ncbi:MAG: SPFH domain-containing protein [Phycisphaerae bacterium]
MKRVPIPTLTTAIALVLILVVYSITYQVRFSESVVKVRFGKPKKEVISQPGLKLKWPAPIERVKHYDTRLRVLDTPETEIKTRDGQTVIVGCFAIWRIQDPLLFFKRVPIEREAENKLRDRINESRAKVIGRHNWSEFVNLDTRLIDQSYEQIENEMRLDAAPGILADYGAELKRVGIWRISLPEEATASVQQSMKQERERMAARFREEGESRKEAIVARAQSQSDTILAFAKSRAAEIEAAGVNASARILKQIGAEDKEFFIWLRWIEAIEAALATRTTILMDANHEIFKHFSEPPTESLLRTE